MACAETGDLSRAILGYLRSVGVHVRPGKLSPSQGKAMPIPARRLFGVPLCSLPLLKPAGGVPRFLVDACELLRLHLHVEGLFRKTGSVTRIKALKTRLEAGENCLHMALPCDVAALVKQFLRDLPEPLIPAELQGLMCHVQKRQEEDRRPLTLLLTCLVPKVSANTLRYFFGFLQDVAARCSQNKMDAANLAVVFAPNLFPSEPSSKLGGGAEEVLQTQAAVVELLIVHASEIGAVPQSLLENVQAAFPDTEHKSQSPPGPGDGRGREADSRRRRRRQRRRSVGNIVTEALSRFKSGRAVRTAPCPETKEGNEFPKDSALRTSFNSKRKASDDILWVSELSVKKRRSTLDSGCSNSSKEEVLVLEQPVDADCVQGPVSPALVFSNNPSNPVSGIGRRSGSPQISPAKIVRRRSSGRTHTQRKHSTRTAPSCSQALFERKDMERKSLRVFFWGSKDLVAEPSGLLLTKKMAGGRPEGPGSHSPKETEERPESQSSDKGVLPYQDQAAPDTAARRKNGSTASPGLGGASCGHRGRASGMAEGLLGCPTEAASPPQRPHVLRRSLSWPEGVSRRGAAEQGETDSLPDEATVVPGDHLGLVEQELPGAEVTATGMRRAGIPAVCVTPAESYGAACPEKEPCVLPSSRGSSQPDLSDCHSARADGFCPLDKVPPSSLKRFTLNLLRTSPQPDEGPNAGRPKGKGGRRFGRSLSHESGLPLRAEEEGAGCAAKKKGAALQPPKSPLWSLKAYGRQIFLTHKHWAVTLGGMRGRKESASQETERAAADCQEPILGCRLKGEQHGSSRSPKFPLVEPQLMTGQSSLDL
ncbi:uncharacterized protein LOC143837085 [Paroedura picta]|uniref:uncharacterized protein LOC143837085 n=1 Tax=Paroedura picta TaxID=143630 RepID=UPI00405692AD